MNDINMLYYDRIDVSEGTDILKQVHQKSMILVITSIFLNIEFKFQPYVSNRFHNLLMMSINLSNNAILKIKNANYRFIISGISKSKAIKLLQNIDLTEKKKWNIIEK